MGGVPGGCFKQLKELLRNKLVHHENRHYDGYRLTYLGCARRDADTCAARRGGALRAQQSKLGLDCVSSHPVCALGDHQLSQELLRRSFASKTLREAAGWLRALGKGWIIPKAICKGQLRHCAAKGAYRASTPPRLATVVHRPSPPTCPWDFY